MFLNDALALSHVPRWAIVRMNRLQTVSDHSYRVAMIAYELLKVAPDGYRLANTLWYALVHDVEESVTGDIPAPAKGAIRGQREIRDGLLPVLPDVGVSAEEMKLVKLADTIEAFTWLSMNGSTGQSYANILQNSIRPAMKEAAEAAGVPSETVANLVNAIIGEVGRMRLV